MFEGYLILLWNDNWDTINKLGIKKCILQNKEITHNVLKQGILIQSPIPLPWTEAVTNRWWFISNQKCWKIHILENKEKFVDSVHNQHGVYLPQNIVDIGIRCWLLQTFWCLCSCWTSLCPLAEKQNSSQGWVNLWLVRLVASLSQEPIVPVSCIVTEVIVNLVIL